MAGITRIDALCVGIVVDLSVVIKAGQSQSLLVADRLSRPVWFREPHAVGSNQVQADSERTSMRGDDFVS